MLAQQHVWRRSQLAALSAANLTGYISYTSGIKKQAKKSFHVFSLWNDLKMLWCWNKYLCQRVSIKNLDTTARRWSSRRVSEIPLATSLIPTIYKSWMFLSYFKNLPHLFLINLHFLRIQPLCLKRRHIGQKGINVADLICSCLLTVAELHFSLSLTTCLAIAVKPFRDLFGAGINPPYHKSYIQWHHLSFNVIWLCMDRNSIISQDGV